jgi:hypothetical protein
VLPFAALTLIGATGALCWKLQCRAASGQEYQSSAAFCGGVFIHQS